MVTGEGWPKIVQDSSTSGIVFSGCVHLCTSCVQLIKVLCFFVWTECATRIVLNVAQIERWLHVPSDRRRHPDEVSTLWVFSHSILGGRLSWTSCWWCIAKSHSVFNLFIISVVSARHPVILCGPTDRYNQPDQSLHGHPLATFGQWTLATVRMDSTSATSHHILQVNPTHYIDCWWGWSFLWTAYIIYIWLGFWVRRKGWVVPFCRSALPVGPDPCYCLLYLLCIKCFNVEVVLVCFLLNRLSIHSMFRVHLAYAITDS